MVAIAHSYDFSLADLLIVLLPKAYHTLLMNLLTGLLNNLLTEMLNEVDILFI